MTDVAAAIDTRSSQFAPPLAPPPAPPLAPLGTDPAEAPDGAAPTGETNPAHAKAIRDASADMLVRVMGNARRTQSRIALSFTSYLLMLVLMFLVGVSAFVIAAIRAAQADSGHDVIVTGIFGGLSATAFVTTFLSRPVTLMNSAGPEAAWLQTIVSTYWAKFAYQNDLSTIAADLDEAQNRFNRDMHQYFARVALLDSDPSDPDSTPTPSR